MIQAIVRISYLQSLRTYGWLSAASIRPTNSSTFTLSDLQYAFTKGFGAPPYIGCSRPRYNATAAANRMLEDVYTVLSEVWYYHQVYGCQQRNHVMPVSARIDGGSVSNSAKAKGAVRYLEGTGGK